MSSIPTTLFTLAFGSEVASIFSIRRFLRIIRLLSLIRVFRLSRILARFYMTNPSSTAIGYFKYGLITVFTSHWSGCLFWMVSDVDDGHGWVDVYNLRDADRLRQYLCSVHWAVATITSVGYGDFVCTHTLMHSRTHALTHASMSTHKHVYTQTWHS